MHLLRSLHSPTSISHRHIPQCGLLISPFTTCHAFPTDIKDSFSPAKSIRVVTLRALQSPAVKSSSTVVEAAPSSVDEKDKNLVFVAGATGRVGSRAVRELLKLGIRVRAGVRSTQRAEGLVQSVEQMKLDGDSTGLVQPIERLDIVECDLEKKDQILPALGKASIVLCCIGASEKEIFDVTGPYRIDYLATKNLIDAATVAKVDHFILLTSLGTNKFGFPAAILNLFWGVLCWKRKAEEALLASGLPYTIVRPGGMERPTDAYKETHNITLSQEDTLFGGQVSNLQVAELMAFMAKNPDLSYCKVVEVIAETTAPLTPLEKLLANIPSQRVNVYKSKETGEASVPEVVSSATPSIDVEDEPTETKATLKTSLSPYIAYEDLKPPTSPTPTPKTGSVTINATGAGATQAETNFSPSPIVVESSELSSTISEAVTSKEGETKKSPLSPYTSYEDLKPPTSPCPTPSGPRQELSSASASDGTATQLIEGNGAAESSNSSITEKDLLLDADVKTSSSPSPSTSNKVKTTPLSPFTMYEDLKPPSSPMPSPKNL